MAEIEDWDLRGCLSENPQTGWNFDDIEQVLGVVEGENDGPDWHWLLSLKDGRYAYLVGGCDYTGWDCGSSAESWLSDSAEGALAVTQHGSWNLSEFDARRQQLRDQLASGKVETTRERIGRELGITP